MEGTRRDYALRDAVKERMAAAGVSYSGTAKYVDRWRRRGVTQPVMTLNAFLHGNCRSFTFPVSSKRLDDKELYKDIGILEQHVDEHALRDGLRADPSFQKALWIMKSPCPRR